MKILDLQTTWLGRHFEFFPEIDSTNRYLQEHAVDRPHGAVALTDLQVQGRGRLQRSWTTPPGDAILMSVLVKPQWPVERLPWLTMIAGLAVADTLIAVSGLHFHLKWPNDVVAPSPAQHPVPLKKIAGILLESAPAGGWVIGMGININQANDDLPDAPTPPTSLRALTGRPFERKPIIKTLLLQLENRYKACDEGISPLPAWRSALLNLGQPVTVHPVSDRPSWTGRAVDVDDSGRLLVENASGSIEALAAGDVSLRPTSP